MPCVARLLWSTLATAACGRVGFDAAARPGDGFATVAPMVELETRCGAVSPASLAVSITNDGVDELQVLTAQATNGFQVISRLPLVIAPGASASVGVQPPPAVIGTDRPGATKQGTLTLTTNAVETPTIEVALVAKVVGAELAIVDTQGMPATLDLLGASGACPVSSFRIVNTGTAPATVQLTSSAELGVSGFSGGLVDGSSSIAFTLRALSSGGCSGIGTVTYAATGDVCTTTPTVLQATFTISGASSCLCS